MLHKCRVPSIHLCPNILLGVSLGLRRKKKHKKSKNDHFLDRVSLSTDLGPSTSDITRTAALNGSAHSDRRRKKPGSDAKNKSAAIKNGKNSNGDSLMGVIKEEFRDIVDHNGAFLANDKSPQICSDSASAGNLRDDSGTYSSDDRRRDPVQKAFMNMLTRGLEETIVARWDGMRLPQSQVTNSGVGSVSIGYIVDEWDEQYDRGKRKKVRSSKSSFNPFQEFARKKAKDGLVQLWK